ncbi:MAG: long-chain fatty acid--CoA ligase [Pseudomonadota bacterium]|nr:long-chain fatty acid--CoA ligase [Pseudomonadota bacterium]
MTIPKNHEVIDFEALREEISIASGPDIPLAVLSVPEMFDTAVARFADLPAIDFMDRVWTYRKLGDLVARAARGFRRLGVTRGVNVGLFLPNSPYSVIAYFAVLKAGGTVVNFNPLYADREIKKQIEDSGAKLMVTIDVPQLTDKLLPIARETGVDHVVVCSMASALPFPKSLLYPIAKRADISRLPRGKDIVKFSSLLKGRGRIETMDIDPENDIAVLQYTGGTTGIPKGAMLTHANVTANTLQCRHVFGVLKDGQERVLAVLPLFHVFAMTTIMNVGIHMGACLIPMPRFDMRQTLKAIAEKKPTYFPAVPSIYTAIANNRKVGDYDLSSIRYCISGGAPLPVLIKTRFEKLTGCVLVEGYGLTESAPVAAANLPDGENRSGSIGVPPPCTTIEIVSTEDRAVLVKRGEKGEICIRGPQVMKGYWNKPDETAGVFMGRRLHTGDIGVMEDGGFVRIVDRIKDVILCGGYNIYPRMVEEAVYLHPKVEECVVAGINHHLRGETVKAWIKIADGETLTRSELQEFLKDKLAQLEIPKLVEIRTEPLPKTMVGKLSRKILLEQEAEKASGQPIKKAAGLE